MLYLLQEIGTKSASEPSQDVTPQLLLSLCNESKASTADETWEEREATLDTEANKTKTAPKLISRLNPRSVMNSEQKHCRYANIKMYFALKLPIFLNSSSLYIY